MRLHQQKIVLQVQSVRIQGASIRKSFLPNLPDSAYRHLVLFTGRPYDTLPSHIDAVSPLYKAITDRLKDATSPLATYALAVTDSSHPLTSKTITPWEKNANRFDIKPLTQDEAYGAVIYPDRISVPFALTRDGVTDQQLDEFCKTLPPAGILESGDADSLQPRDNNSIDVFVCVSPANASPSHEY